MRKSFKSLLSISAVVALTSFNASAAFAITPEVVNNTTFSATHTNVTVTLGNTAGYNANATDQLWFNTDASGGLTGAWVRWTFSTPVTKVRIYYGHVESVLYSNNSGDNDPQRWKTNRGNVNFSEVGSGGNKEASAGEVISGQPEASLSGNVADCVAPNVACSGYVDLSFPQGVSWIETQNAPGGGGPGYNAVGLALDAGDPGVSAENLANTGSDSSLAWLALGSLMLGAGLVMGRKVLS